MLSKEDILKISQLSKLHLSEEEIIRFQKELSEILVFFEKLSEVDTDNTLPTAQITGIMNGTREDKPLNFDSKDLLRCSPQKNNEDHISVPSVF